MGDDVAVNREDRGTRAGSWFVPRSALDFDVDFRGEPLPFSFFSSICCSGCRGGGGFFWLCF